MKKLLSCLSVALCIAVTTVCLAACGNKDRWILPEFTVNSPNYTIEHITNMENDFEFPIEGKKFEHANFEKGTLEYCWVIYDGNEIAGWIETSGAYGIDSKGNCSYGYCTMNVNEVFCFPNANLTLTLKGEDTSVFDNIQITSNYGTVTKGEAFKAAEMYSEYDEATNTLIPIKGAENFVYCHVEIALADIAPDTIESIKIQINL